MGTGPRPVGPTLEALVRNINGAPEAPRESVEEPAQTVAFDANVIAVAVSDEEACLDFYHTSAFSVLHAKTLRKLAVEPVVRVTLRTVQLFGLYLRLKAADMQVLQDAGATT
jgi:hypothetical protein